MEVPPASGSSSEARARLAVPLPVPAGEDKPLYVVWTFKNGLPSEFESNVRNDKYEWRKLPDGGELVGLVPVALLLPIVAPRRPFVVKVDIKLAEKFHSTIDAAWQNDSEGLAHHAWNGMPSASTFERTSVSFYYLGRYVVSCWRGKVYKVSEFEDAYPTDKACIRYMVCGITRIELKTLLENEIPSEMKDMPRLKQLILKGKGAQSGAVPKFEITPSAKAPLPKSKIDSSVSGA